MKTQVDITLIGCGKMGSALLKIWLDRNLIKTATVIEPNPLDALFKHNKILKHHTALPDAPITSDIVILAIKPQMMQQASTTLAKHLTSKTVILSIAAGQSLATLSKIFGNQAPIIRTMPNTPAAIGKGMTAAIGNANVTTAQKQSAQNLLAATGLVEWITDESLMDAITALSGSGPAYIFYMIEALAKAGEDIGLSADSAMTLARQTVIGSASLAESEATTPAATLRKNVTSPGGTTEAALKILMDGRYQTLLTEVLRAAQNRSKELN